MRGKRNIPAVIVAIAVSIATSAAVDFYYKDNREFTITEDSEMFMALQFRGMASKYGTFNTLDKDGKIVHIYPSQDSYKSMSGYRSSSLECFKVTERIYRSKQTTEIRKKLILKKFKKFPISECEN